MERPDDATMHWVEATLGPFEILSRFAHSHGYSRLWRLRAGGRTAWLKMHAHPHKWAGEVHALANWTLSLGLVPSLLAAQAEPCAVLLSEAPGDDAEPLELSPQAESWLWREAGVWLARLHERENDWFGNVAWDGSPHGEPAFDASDHLGSQWDERLAQARRSGLFETAEIDFAAARTRDGLPLFRDERARAIHRDYSPRNWRTHPDGRLAAVIDFEHARWDVRAADLQRPWSREFLRRPELVDAFYEGYGELSEGLRAQIGTMRVVMAMTTIVWATGVGDPAFVAEARGDLRRLMDDG